MKRKILIPTDFSRNAWDAIAYAVDLYKPYVCEFYLLHVYNLANYATDNLMTTAMDQGLFETLKDNSDKGLKKILQRLSFRDESETHTFITLSQQNDLLDAISKVVEMKDIDLIVMGTKGDTNAINTSFGSNTMRVMEYVRNCPVLAIPPETVYHPPKEIVFPTSFKTHFKKRELQFLVEIATITKAPIRVLHVQEEDQLSEEQQNFKGILEDILEEVPYSFHFVENDSVNDAVDLFVQSRGSGMVVFVNKKHTLFSKLFSNPMVKELGLHTKVPIMALHDLRN